jgi:outer membrane protein OmpA-like peptidoglycan-associated protein
MGGSSVSVTATPVAPTQIAAPVAPVEPVEPVAEIVAPVAPVAPVASVEPVAQIVAPVAQIAENAKPAVKITKVGLIHMSSNSYLLTSLMRQKLEVLAKRIIATDVKRIFVYGHTDIRAGISNAWLSEQRASAVAKYLRPLLGGKKLTIRWFASRKPVAMGLSKSALAKNRRVEIWTT